MIKWVPKVSAAPEVFAAIKVCKAAFCRLYWLVSCKALLELSKPVKVPVLPSPLGQLCTDILGDLEFGV